MNSDPCHGVEDFREVPPDNDITIEEEAEEGRNLGFAKLPSRSVTREIKENRGKKER